jgi:hypothetical protein
MGRRRKAGGRRQAAGSRRQAAGGSEGPFETLRGEFFAGWWGLFWLRDLLGFRGKYGGFLVECGLNGGFDGGFYVDFFC